MKKLYVVLTLVTLLLCLSGWVVRARGQATNARKQSWEYRVDSVPGVERSLQSATEFDKPVMERNRSADEHLINQRAAEGWQLTAVGGYFYYFKRAK